MKEAELRKHATCNLCRRKIGESGLPLFWRITVDRFGIDMKAARQQTGFAMMLGSATLAQVMGSDADMATQIGEPSVLTVCETCSTADIEHCVASLAEIGSAA